jgi:HMG (high mobility group) box
MDLQEMSDVKIEQKPNAKRGKKRVKPAEDPTTSSEVTTKKRKNKSVKAAATTTVTEIPVHRSQSALKRMGDEILRRPASAYVLFLQARSAILKQSNPLMKSKDIMKAVGVEWNQTPEAERTPFERKAKEMLEQYNQRKAELTAADKATMEGIHKSLVELRKIKKMKKQRQTNPLGLKPPASAYGIFCAQKHTEKVATMPDFADRVRFCATLWKTMSAEDKKVYEDQAQAARVTFEAALKNAVES